MVVQFLRAWLRATRCCPSTPARRAAWRLQVEPLEDRSLPSTFIVLNLADSGAGSLRQAVLAANAAPGADAITFAPGVHGAITLTNGELAISDDLTISGPGAGQLTVSGNHASRIFNVSGSQLTIAGLTVADGLATGRQALGGGLLNTGGYVTLADVTFTNNLARGDAGPHPVAGGGAIANLVGSTLTIIASTFTSNQCYASSVSAGGAILNDTGSHLIVVDSRFTGNQATGSVEDLVLLGSAGGAIANMGDSDAVITHTTFAGNQTRGGDGRLGRVDGGLAIGGAIENSGVSLLGNKVGRPTLTVAQSWFSANQVIGGAGAAADGPKGGGQGGDAFGGTISSDFGATTRITDTEFRGNRALGGAGGLGTGGAAGGDGGRVIGGALTNVNSDLTIDRSTFIDNQAVGGAGGSSTSKGGTGGSSKGGVLHVIDHISSPGGHATTTVIDSTMTGNQAIGGAGGDGGLGQGGNTLRGKGGALSLNNGTLNVIRCRLDGNQAIGGAGGSGATPGLAGVGRGGGIVVDNQESGKSALTVSDCLLRNNQAIGGSGSMGGSGMGGGLFIGVETSEQVTATVTNTVIVNNQAIGGTGNVHGGDGLGAGVYVAAGRTTLTLFASTVTTNQAQGGAGIIPGNGIGGGLYIVPGGTVYADLHTLIFGNDTSTSDDDIFGIVTLL